MISRVYLPSHGKKCEWTAQWALMSDYIVFCSKPSSIHYSIYHKAFVPYQNSSFFLSILLRTCTFIYGILCEIRVDRHVNHMNVYHLVDLCSTVQNVIREKKKSQRRMKKNVLDRKRGRTYKTKKFNSRRVRFH